MRPAATDEDELILHLVGTSERRHAAADRIQALSTRVDTELLAELLSEQRLMALVGTRLRESSPVPLAPALDSAIDQAVREAAGNQAITSMFISQACHMLEDGGVPVLALKGAALAERLYGEAALRAPSRDIDLLVDPRDFERASALLNELGYVRADPTNWVDGLPHYHVLFLPTEGPRPLIELHWRVHWYETEFASRVLERSVAGGFYGRSPDPLDDLALLMIIHARDAFTGLRFAADIAAFWDRYGDDLAPGALDGICERHPELEAPIVASALVCERLTGVPAAALVSKAASPSVRVGLATRLANWTRHADPDDPEATITLTDALLLPKRGLRIFAGHYWLQPVEFYEHTYDWEPSRRGVNRVRVLLHAGARAVKSPFKYIPRLWWVRGGRYLAELPKEVAAPSR